MFKNHDPQRHKGTLKIGKFVVETEYWVRAFSGKTWTSPEQMDAILDRYNEMKKEDDGTRTE